MSAKIWTGLRSIISQEQGQSLVEYVLILFLVSIAGGVVLQAFAGSVQNLFNNLAAAV